MMKVLVGYPSEEEEFVIVERVTGPAIEVSPVATTEELATLQAECRRVYVDPALVQFAVKIVAATRNPAACGLPELARYIGFGASPRATISMIEGARALALLRGRSYVLPADVIDLVADVLRHRLVLSYEALSENLSPDQLIGKLLRAIPAPDTPLSTHVRLGESA
jgi:MoxR-like ATPase